MIALGADFGVQNEWGRTPLHVAVRRGCSEVVEFLIEQGADATLATKEGWTPLHVAYRSGHEHIIEMLLSKGLSRDVKDESGKIPPEHAMERPKPIPLDASRLDEYVGTYVGDEGNPMFKVWKENYRLFLLEFAPDEIYPVAKDELFCKQEPW
jgi:hypothetical protein